MPTPGKNKRILVFGVIFDPIHRGHLALLRAAVRERRPNLTLVIPTADIPVHKRKTLFGAALRLKTLRATLKTWPRCQILTHELQEPAAAWVTIGRIARRFPGVSIDLLIGSDNLASIHKWKKSERILGNPKITLVAGYRPGFFAKRLSLKKNGCGFHLLKGKFPDVSSTVLRLGLTDPRAPARQKAWRQVPAPARPVLKTPNALNCLAEAYIRRHLPPERFRHSLAVARLARELALRHRVNQQKAWLAGLLHDASRTQNFFSGFNDAMAHAERSRRIAQTVFSVKDRGILQAIARHTLGSPGMGKLAQILYVADLAGYDRRFSQAAPMRRLARNNLSEALHRAVKTKILYLVRANQIIHPKGLKFWNSLNKKISKQ